MKQLPSALYHEFTYDELRVGRADVAGQTVHAQVVLRNVPKYSGILVRPISASCGYHGVHCYLNGARDFGWTGLNAHTVYHADVIDPRGLLVVLRRVQPKNIVRVSNSWRKEDSSDMRDFRNMGVIIDRDPEKPHVAVCRFSDGPNPVPDFTSLVVELALLDLGPRPKLEEKDGYWLPPEDPVYLDIWQHIVL